MQHLYCIDNKLMNIKEVKTMTQFFKERGIDMPELYAQEFEENPVAYAHFIAGNWQWYVTEASERDGEVLLFGLVDGDDKEFGYFTLMQLASIGAGLDVDFKPTRIFDMFEELRR